MVRAQRYELLATARDLLRSEGRAAGLVHPSDYHRTAKCSHTPISEVAVLRSKEHGSAFYRGLAICGNVGLAQFVQPKYRNGGVPR